VYGIYLLESRQVWTPQLGQPDGIGLAAAPADLAAFVALGDAMMQSRRMRAFLATDIESDC